MDYEKIELIKSDLVKRLKPSRYEHTLGVAYTAAALAMRYGEDINKAFITGLLHDCAKYLTAKELVEECEKNNIKLNEHEYKYTSLIHQKAGAFLAKNRYDVQDEDICHAVSCHTTGDINMNLLDKIIYIADYIEPHRDKAPRLNELRKLAFIDIDECLVETASGTIEYVLQQCGEVDDFTLEVFENMKKNNMIRKTLN